MSNKPQSAPEKDAAAVELLYNIPHSFCVCDEPQNLVKCFDELRRPIFDISDLKSKSSSKKPVSKGQERVLKELQNDTRKTTDRRREKVAKGHFYTF